MTRYKRATNPSMLSWHHPRFSPIPKRLWPGSWGRGAVQSTTSSAECAPIRPLGWIESPHHRQIHEHFSQRVAHTWRSIADSSCQSVPARISLGRWGSHLTRIRVSSFGQVGDYPCHARDILAAAIPSRRFPSSLHPSTRNGNTARWFSTGARQPLRRASPFRDHLRRFLA